MAGPIDAVTAFHNAFRRDARTIDEAALELARGNPGQRAGFERYRFLNEILVWHANGEELAVFPAVEQVAPSVTEPYATDHRGLDEAYEAIAAAASAGDALAAARATAAFKLHLDMHLRKEDAHLYPLMRARVSPDEQARAVGSIAAAVPRERFPEVVAWLFPLLTFKDRENMVTFMHAIMPAPVFADAAPLIRKAVGGDWAELVKRIPGLE